MSMKAAIKAEPPNSLIGSTRLKELTDKMYCGDFNNVCREHVLSAVSDLKVSYEYSEYYDEELEDVFGVPAPVMYNEKRDGGQYGYATGTTPLYEENVLMAAGASTARIKAKCSQKRINALLEMITDASGAAIVGQGESQWMRMVDTEELSRVFGKKLGGYISRANIEMYNYGESKYSLVSRVPLPEMEPGDLDKAIGDLWDINNDKESDPDYKDIMEAAAERKYQLLSHVLSSLVLADTLWEGVHNYFSFETKYIGQHYGRASSKIIRPILSGMGKDYPSVKKQILHIFENLPAPKKDMSGKDVLLCINLTADMPSNEKLLDFVTSSWRIMGDGAKGKAFGKPLIVAPGGEAGMGWASKSSLADYFKDGGFDNTHRAFVRASIEGSISVGPGCYKCGHIEIFSKTEEASVPVPENPREWLTGRAVAHAKDIRYGMAYFLSKLSQEINAHILHINSNTTAVEGGVAIMDELKELKNEAEQKKQAELLIKQVRLGKLKNLWRHMEENDKKKLDNLLDNELDCLYTLFCQEGEYIVPDGDWDSTGVADGDCGELDAEDIEIELDGECTLLARVGAVVIKNDGGYQKKLVGAGSLPQYARIYYDYNDDTQEEFDREIKEIFYKEFYSG